MAKVKFEQAMADWPKTKMLKDGGVHVFGKYEQPGLGEMMLFLWSLPAFVVAFWIVSVNGNPAVALAAAGFIMLMYPLGVRSMMVDMLGKKIDIKVYGDKLQVRHGFGYKNYSRSLPLEFRIEEHQKSIEDQLKQRSRRTYREAIEVVMQYGEKRVPLADMSLKHVEKAKAIVIRLQNVCAAYDQAVQQQMAQQQMGQFMTPAAPAGGDFGVAPPIR